MSEMGIFRHSRQRPLHPVLEFGWLVAGQDQNLLFSKLPCSLFAIQQERESYCSLCPKAIKATVPPEFLPLAR